MSLSSLSKAARISCLTSSGAVAPLPVPSERRSSSVLRVARAEPAPKRRAEVGVGWRRRRPRWRKRPRRRPRRRTGGVDVMAGIGNFGGEDDGEVFPATWERLPPNPSSPAMRL